MNVKSSIVAALVAGLLPMAAIAQTAPAASAAAPAAAPATPPAAATAEAKLPPPAAFPAKIALVNFIVAVESTNEGQRSAQEIDKKYETQKSKLQTQAAEVDALKKKLQGAPATMTDDERGKLTRDIDSKDKALQRDYEDTTNAFNSDMNDALQKVAAKVHDVMIKYVQSNGYTLLLNYGGDQQSPLMWAAQDQNADITEALVDEYNKTSGVTAPTPLAPSAPSAGAGAATHRPAGTTGATHSTTTPHTATPAK